MLEPTKVIVEITMTDEITGRSSKTRYGLHEALYYVNGAAEFHADYMDYVYGNLEHAVRVHLKKEGHTP